jgi:CheY-like chemotaxis protein
MFQFIQMVRAGSNAGLLFEICRCGSKGSSDTFGKETIPLVDRLGPFGATTGEEGGAHGASGGKHRLRLEDDATLWNAVRRLLKSAQYRVIRFASAEKFGQSDFKNSPGWLLPDIRLSGISRFELQEQLLASGAQMPVIFMTGQDRTGMEKRAMGLAPLPVCGNPLMKKPCLARFAPPWNLHQKKRRMQ